MPVTLNGRFDTRRDAEMAVERLVQEHGIDRRAVRIAPAGSKNSAGDERAGSDMAAGAPTSPPRADAALEGEIVVSVDVAEENAAKVRSAFAEFEGEAL